MKNSSQVTTALALIAQAFVKHPEMFELFNQFSLLGTSTSEKLIIRLAIYFDIQDIHELRERFYRLFYPEIAELVLSTNIIVLSDDVSELL